MTLDSYVKKYRALFRDKNPQIKTAHTNDGHFYVSPADPAPYHSVTYFTSFIKDPSIANWRKNKALERFKQLWETDIKNNTHVDIDYYIGQASIAPEGQFQLAGDIGSTTHSIRQQWFQEWIDSGVIQKTDAEIDALPIPENVELEVISGCRAIKRFLKETGYIPVACELALVDDELKVGGQIDDLGVFPNLTKIPVTVHTGDYKYTAVGTELAEWAKGGYKIKYHPYLGFVDLKTSSQGKKPAYAFQVRGFYQKMIWKTFRVKPKKTFILHTSKADGTYQLPDLTDMKFLEKDCADLVRLSRSWDRVIQAFKPKVITI